MFVHTSRSACESFASFASPRSPTQRSEKTLVERKLPRNTVKSAARVICHVRSPSTQLFPCCFSHISYVITRFVCIYVFSFLFLSFVFRSLCLFLSLFLSLSLSYSLCLFVSRKHTHTQTHLHTHTRSHTDEPTIVSCRSVDDDSED